MDYWAKLVPELLVTNLAESLRFWCDVIGFHIAYKRAEDNFAYLNLGRAQIMLEEYGGGQRQWVTGTLKRPFGRGINFQTEVECLTPIIDRLIAASWPLFLNIEEKWYRNGTIEAGQKQFIVADPDGYLLRIYTDIGERSI